MKNINSSFKIIIKRQTKILLLNAEATFKAVPAAKFNTITCGYPYWKHFYHAIHSLDQWLINPNMFIEPPFHTRGMNSYGAGPGKALTKPQLEKYFRSVKVKILKYTNRLKISYLAMRPEGCKFTRLDLILAQYRHFMYHIGFIHACIRHDTGRWPEYIGISEPITK